MLDDQIEIFRENLRFLRKKAGLSQAQLGQECNLSASYIGKIERSDKYPSFETLLRISDVLDVSLLELFDPAIQENGERSMEGDLLGEDFPELLQFVRRFQYLEEGVCMSDRQGRILYANDAYSFLIKHRKNNLQGASLEDVDPRFSGEAYDDFWESIRPGEHHVEEVELQNFPNTTVPVRFINSKTTIGNHLILFLIAQPDPVGRQSDVESNDSFRDWDSGLYNQQFYLEVLKKKIHEAKRYDLPLTTGIFSLENHGSLERSHQPGTEQTPPPENLVHLFRSLDQTLRKSDVIGRIDVNELAFLLPNTELEDARKMQKRVHSAFQEGNNTDFKIKLRTGLAEFPNHGENRVELLKSVREQFSTINGSD